MRRRGEKERRGVGGLSSSINFQMSVAKNSLPPPPSLTNTHRLAHTLDARVSAHAALCAPSLSALAAAVPLHELHDANTPPLRHIHTRAHARAHLAIISMLTGSL